MKTVTAKIKTAVVAAVLITGIAGSAAAQNTNPFVNGQVPHKASPHSNPNTGNTYGKRYSKRDTRLARYLVGTWQYRVRNGRRYRIRFMRDGRVAMARRGSNIAVVGRYTVRRGQIRFRLVARCSISAKRCKRLSRAKVATIAFRPVDRRTLRVRNGYMRRVG